MSQLELGFSREEMSRLPESDWSPPRMLPDRLEGVIAVDLETRDNGLSKGKGSAWPWRDGYVVGYAVVADNFQGYLPIRHEGGGNLDEGLVRRWLNSVLSREDQLKVFANAQYDLGWAEVDGVAIRGPMVDVQWAEALLDEHRASYSLEALARDYLGEGKDETLLRDAANAFGVDPKSGLWQLPPRFVGVYAERDALATREVWKVQEPRIEAEGLRTVFDLEHKLLPLYLSIRRRGVRVDVPRVEQLIREKEAERDRIVEEIRRRTGKAVNIWAAASIAKAFDQEGLAYGLTRKTQTPSITKALLSSLDHWLPRAILRARELDKLVGTFLQGQLLQHSHRGRVYGEIHPLRSDQGGTISGRLSMSNPNLQFIPSRTEEGREIRRCFLPEEGESWASLDFSQQEPRLLVHFACKVRRGGRPLPRALEARDRYRNDPEASYHQMTAELTGLEYKRAKILNLAIIYGRGVAATAEEMGLPRAEVEEMFRRHHEEMPFARELAKVCQECVSRRGYIRSLLGRKSRFVRWEPARWSARDGRELPLEEARRAWPGETRFVRARLHKALNALIQPSAADQIKAAMGLILDEGLGDRILIQVHDELCSSIPDVATARRMAELMEAAVELEVPSKVDIEISDRWEGEAHDV